MDFVNETKVEAGWTLGFEPDGRELLVIVIKATYKIPEKGAEPVLAEEQVPLTEADEFTGEPGLTAVKYETDYAHRKPMCDVLLNGSAYAPEGRPISRVQVGLKVGAMTKSFNVIGNRYWEAGAVSIGPGYPGNFISMPISYDNAFGGVDNFHQDESKHRTYVWNPVGTGYHEDLDGALVDGTPMPNTEQLNKAVKMPLNNYKPMAFGAMGRNFKSRYPLAGTYDRQWLDTQAPFWPDNFDYRYFQAAPPDQQIPYPVGGEEVILKNLMPNGSISFRLPFKSMLVLFIPYIGKEYLVDAMIDTLLFEPDKKQFVMTWRISYPLRRNCFELKQVIAGELSKRWHDARRFGDKPYYKNLAELVKARK